MNLIPCHFCFIWKLLRIHSLLLRSKWLLHMKSRGVPVVAQWKWIRLGTMRLWVQSLASVSGLRIWHCLEMWCRSQTRLGSGIPVALVLLWLWCRLAATALIRPLAWEPPICHGRGPRNGKKKRPQKKKAGSYPWPWDLPWC